MGPKSPLAVFLLICVSICVAEEVLSAKRLEKVCSGECPEYELLCSNPEYDVRRYKSALWISTTESDLSLTPGSERAWNRIHEYFKGKNDQSVKMTYTAPMVTQTRGSLGTPLREITVSVPLPKKMTKTPPVPADPKVVIDLMPESIMYVKKFEGRSNRVGFVPDLEAKNFFKILSDNKEPFNGEDDYYYVAQYDSKGGPSGPLTYNEIGVFALNERVYRVHEFNDRVRQGSPKCLQNDERLRSWGKIVQADIPIGALVRRHCSGTHCKAPKTCPKPEVKELKGAEDQTVTLKKYTDLQYASFSPYTCHYDTAIIASAEPLARHLNKTGVPHGKVAMMSTSVVEIRKDLDGKEGCKKFYNIYALRGGASGDPEKDFHELSLEQPDWHGLRSPKTKDVYHLRKSHERQDFYTRCMGGNIYYEPGTTTSVANALMDSLREEKRCFLGDHIGVLEYHPQSRLFDRFNEVYVDADLDCTLQDDRPPFTFHLPLSKAYGRSEEKPVFGDRCTDYECPNMSIAMRFENNLRLMRHPPAAWLCANSTSLSCTYEQAWQRALQPILSYINGKNEDNVRMDLTRPLYGQSFSGNDECPKLFTLCMMVPTKYADNPPKPTDDSVAFRTGDKDSYWYQSVFVGKPSPDVVNKYLTQMTKQLDELKTFGVNYTTEHIWVGSYDNPENENGLHELIIVDQQHIYWKESPKQKGVGQGEAKEGRGHPGDEGGNLVPENCHLPTCHPVHVTKEHGNYMEIYFPKSKGVCQHVKGCKRLGNARRALFPPLFRYFSGDNVEKETIGPMTFPLVLQIKIYSPVEEAAGVGRCEREYRACAQLPPAYADKEIPTPTGEDMATFDAQDGAHGYAIAAKGSFNSIDVPGTARRLMKILHQEHVHFDQDWLLIFTHGNEFTNQGNKTMYFSFLKKKGMSDGVHPSDDQEK